ncbi:MAG: hypothetical protein LBS21_05625, partial [Clostridiales bacterium]|nr:hypothetical protein [Clostridiales bacterium]
HDQNGNILTVANENGTTKREYDKNDRVTKFTDVNGNAIGYTYDEAGNLIKLTYPAGEVVSYTYDALNRITAVTDYNGRITKYEYDKNSRLVKTTRPDGSVEEITYDRAGRMTAKIDKAATGELISQYEYTYNANGDIIEEKDLPGNRTTPIKAESTEMTYGTANRLESVNGQVVSYDADGNMIKGVLGGGAASFGYDKFNRLIRVSAEGTENAENTTVYKYDGEGNRISVNNNGEITVFVTDPTGSLSNLLESRNSDGSKNIYVYGVGLISQEQVTAGATGKAAKATPENTTEYRLFHYDYRGSTTAITNASGNVTDRVVYSPYGKIDERTGETKTRFLYVGQFGVQVDENGLYYMRARYYDTLTSRMLTEDPYWDEENMIHGKGNDFIPIISKVKQSSNLYTYCMSSPMSYVDLTGMDAIYMTYTQGAHIAFWNFGHSAIAFQDADDNWWFMSFEGYNSSKLDIRVFFYQLTDIVWNDDMSKMIRANFLIPDEKGKSSTQHYYNGEKVDGEFIYDYRQISIYDSQVYINGDFSKSYDKALGYSMDYPFYWLTAVNCSWLALFVLQESTTGDTYDKLENYLWYLKINRNAVWPTPIVTKEIRTIIPNWSIEDINWLFEKEEE